MPLTNEQVATFASQAVEKMFREHDPDYTFPFDAIWQNVPPDIDIPSLSRPHQWRALVKKGLVERTGGMIKASSDKRAGSATPEYRFGPTLVPREPTQLSNIGPGTVRTSVSLNRLQQAMDSEGYVISSAELANFLLAMIVSPLVILSGISGTGKSLLPRKFAKHTRSGFHSIAVQPQWSDNSDLFGYRPTLAPETFIEGRLISALRDANQHGGKLVIALLDEMNLAPIEHYFSDFLSVAESRARDKGAVVTDALPIDLPKLAPGQVDLHADLREIGLPHNLRVVGTANMDETTHSFSPKVLDRAFTIEFDDPDLTVFASGITGVSESFESLAAVIVSLSNATSVAEASVASQSLFDEIAQMLEEIQLILAPAGIKFGYRTRDSILLYLHFWKQLGIADILSASAALDFCLLQKILPKVSGSGDTLASALDGLAAWLKKERVPPAEMSNADKTTGFNGPFIRSLKKVERMATQLESDGATHYWGT